MTSNLDFQALSNFVEKSLFFYDLPGLSVYVDFGERSFSASEGYQDFVEKRPLTKESVFHMGSVTKLFVGTSILKLYEQGKLDLDDKLIEHLPWFTMADPKYTRITLRQLMSHTSGMPDVSDYHWEAPETDEKALERYVRSAEVAEAFLLRSPEEGLFTYSNMAYEILGMVVASISNSSFEDYVKGEFFEPLSMGDSSLLTFQRDPSALCTPHLKNSKNQIIPAPHFPYNRAHGPSSTLTSTTADLSKWAKAHLAKKVLKPDTYAQAWSHIAPVPNNGEHIGLSWFCRQQRGYSLFGHEGTDDGFRASFWICPDLDLHISVCCNLSGAPTKKINKQIFDLLIGA